MIQPCVLYAEDLELWDAIPDGPMRRVGTGVEDRTGGRYGILRFRDHFFPGGGGCDLFSAAQRAWPPDRQRTSALRSLFGEPQPRQGARGRPGERRVAAAQAKR